MSKSIAYHGLKILITVKILSAIFYNSVGWLLCVNLKAKVKLDLWSLVRVGDFIVSQFKPFTIHLDMLYTPQRKIILNKLNSEAL